MHYRGAAIGQATAGQNRSREAGRPYPAGDATLGADLATGYSWPLAGIAG